MDTTEWSNAEKLLMNWHRQINRNSKLHKEASKRYGKYYYLIYIPIIIFSAFSATSIFSQLDGCDPNNKTERAMDLLSGALGTISGILAAIEALFKLSKRESDHNFAATRYSSLYRYIETILTLNRGDREKPLQVLNSVRKQFDDIVSNSPTIKDDLYKSYLYVVKHVNDAEVTVPINVFSTAPELKTSTKLAVKPHHVRSTSDGGMASSISTQHTENLQYNTEYDARYCDIEEGPCIFVTPTTQMDLMSERETEDIKVLRKKIMQSPLNYQIERMRNNLK